MPGYLALDWGQKRVGIATMDPLGLAITVHKAVHRNASFQDRWQWRQEDQDWLQSLVDSYEPECLVLGLPLSASGEAAQSARALGQKLESQFMIPVRYIDETLSSWESKGDDSKAAALLLEGLQLEIQSSKK